MALGRPAALLDIVEEHFDELDFLWEHREANIFTADWSLRNLAEHEERIAAHLDGLRVAELHGVDLARERIAGGTQSAAAAATFVLIESREPELIDLVMSHLRTGDIPVVDGIRSVLRHYRHDRFQASLAGFATELESVCAAAAADVLAFHRESVPTLDRLLTGETPWGRCLALGAAGRLRRLREQDLTKALQSVDMIERRAALQAAARSGLPGLAGWCRAAATRATDPDPEALLFLGVLGDPRDLNTLHAALKHPDLAMAATVGFGAMGRVQAVPLLLELMADKALGVAATAAYKRITGASAVEGAKPFPPPPVGEGEDEEEALPPDPAKAAADWRERSKAMTSDRAWQSGVPIGDVGLPLELDHLPLDCRRDVFLRLCSRGPGGVPDLELETFAARQGRR